jgi:hypothetical protein
VNIEGTAVVTTAYSNEFRGFFLGVLQISPASLATLVTELQQLVMRDPSVSKVKEMIWAINAMDPVESDLAPLRNSKFLPVRQKDQNGTTLTDFQIQTDDFVINDRNRIAGIFQRESRIAFLDFTLEEIGQLNPLLQTLGLGTRYLSFLSDEMTACEDNGQIDAIQTSIFRDRAHYLLRYVARKMWGASINVISQGVPSLSEVQKR